MDLLEDLRMPLLNFDFVMIYIIYKILILLKNRLSYFKDSIFECFFMNYNRPLFFVFLKIIFFTFNESSRPEEENIVKDIRNLFRQRKELNYIAVNNIRNLF